MSRRFEMNYYNEHDPKMAAWLRELISMKLIPDGYIDERSIEDVQPYELIEYTQCHFFAGISGWSRALQLAGWPEDKPIWTGSCPCQPFSQSGKGAGIADERHLWPAFKWLIEQCRPAVVFGEQVASGLGREWLAGVRVDLEALGYEVGAADLCAASVGAPHIRQRLYWVADAERNAGESRWASNQSREGDGAEGAGAHVEFGRCGNPDRLGDSDSPGSQGRNGAELPECSGEQIAGAGGSSGGVANSGSTDFQFRPEAQRQTKPPRSSWEQYEIRDCLDGKSRRIESGSAPLVAGLPSGVVRSGPVSISEAQTTAEARVMRLHGYGNSIVTQLAAEFIRAALP